jgi:hypothetical protein
MAHHTPTSNVGGWGWLQSWTMFVSFVCARGMVVRWNSSPKPTNGFSIFHFVTPTFAFSLVWHVVFPFPHWNSKWNQSEIEVNRHEIEVTSKWNQNEIDMTSKWSRSEIDVKSKCIRSEIEVKSNWNQSELNVKSKWIRSEIEVTSKWARNKFEVKSKWPLPPPPPPPHHPPPPPPNSYPVLVGIIGMLHHWTPHVC